MSDNDGLSSFYSAFPADDLMIDIVPSLDAPQQFSLLSCPRPIGPFRAGIPTQVPLWLALFLQQRSLCRISLPSWMSVESLSKVLDYERTHQELWSDPQALPHDYYERTQRLETTASHMAAEYTAVSLLVQDIFQVRCDKLQQQFQKLLKENAGNLLVNVNGIASQELALLRPFVLQALNDQHSLSQGEKEGQRETATANESDQGFDKPKPRVPLRRFRQ